jgi:hypothetical protein
MNLRRARKNCSMKTFPALLLAGVLAIPSFAQETITNTAPEETSSNQMAQAVVMLPASAGTVTAPLVLTNGGISQPEPTELPSGGKAIYRFTLPNTGDYVIQALVNAPDEGSNSFYVNVDADPQDPMMIWDIDVTNGFEERTVSWRGNGDANNDEIVPKRFHLSAGAHKLVIVGREPTELKSISIRPAAS